MKQRVQAPQRSASGAVEARHRIERTDGERGRARVAQMDHERQDESTEEQPEIPRASQVDTERDRGG